MPQASQTHAIIAMRHCQRARGAPRREACMCSCSQRANTRVSAGAGVGANVAKTCAATAIVSESGSGEPRCAGGACPGKRSCSCSRIQPRSPSSTPSRPGVTIRGEPAGSVGGGQERRERGVQRAEGCVGVPPSARALRRHCPCGSRGWHRTPMLQPAVHPQPVHVLEPKEAAWRASRCARQGRR